MSSFFKRQPELFDTKKLGTSQGSGTNLAAAGLALSPPSSAPAAAPSASADDAENGSGPENNNNTIESWVELAPSRASLCSSIEAVLVESTSGDKDSRLSPVSLQSPHVEFESSLEQVKYRLVRDMLPFADGSKSTDWLWDWSTRSEAGGPVQKATRHRSNGNSAVGGQIGSTLTTPPNSPEPESSEFEFKSKSSGRSLGKKKLVGGGTHSVFSRIEVIFGLVFSNLVTFFLGAAIGFCICRKMIWKGNSGSDPFEEFAFTNYYG